MLGFLAFGTTLACLDLAIKNQVEEQPAERFPRELKGTKGLIWLYRNHNPGFSFGVLKEYPQIVERIPLCIVSALVGIWTYVIGRPGRLVEKLGLTLAIAGGASNLYDRLKRGYVVDYFSIRWKALKKVVFNLGDFFILLGAVLTAAAGIAEALKEK